MKKTIVAFACVFSLNTYSQTDSMDQDLGTAMLQLFNATITMNVDSTLFPIHQGNFYVSEKPQATIMAVLVPQSFDKANEKIVSDTKTKTLPLKNREN